MKTIMNNNNNESTLKYQSSNVSSPTNNINTTNNTDIVKDDLNTLSCVYSLLHSHCLIHPADVSAKRLFNVLHKLSDDPNTIIYAHVLSYRSPYPILLSPDYLLSLINSLSHLSVTCLSPSIYHRSLAFVCLLIALHVHRYLIHLLIRRLHSLQKHIKYWKHQDDESGIPNKFKKQLKKFRFHYFNNTPDSTNLSTSNVPSSLSTLLHFRHIWLHRVGLLHERLCSIRRWCCTPISSSHLQAVMELNACYANNVYYYMIDEVPTRPLSDVMSIISVYQHSLSVSSQFRLRLQHQCKKAHAPSHLRRYWHLYGIGAAVTAYSLHWIYLNRVPLIDSSFQYWHSLRSFGQSHLIEPVKEIVQSVFHSMSDEQLQKSKMNHQISQRALTSMLKEYAEKNLSKLSSQEGVSKEQFLSSLSSRTRIHDMSFVMADYAAQVSRPITNSMFAELIHNLLIQITKAKLDIEEALMTCDNILKANQINFQLLTTIPALLGILGIVALTHNTIRRMILRRHTKKTVYRSLNQRLRKVEQLLIQFATSPRNQEQSIEINLSSSSLSLPLTAYDQLNELALLHLTQVQNEKTQMFNDEEEYDESNDSYDQLNIQDKDEELLRQREHTVLNKPRHSGIINTLRSEVTYHFPSIGSGQLLLHLYDVTSVLEHQLTSDERCSLLSDINRLCYAYLSADQQLSLVNQIFHSHQLLSQ